MKLYNLNRKIPFIALMVFLSSCVNMNNIAPTYNEAFVAVRGALLGFKDIDITRKSVDEIPYASALLKIGKGSKGLIILERLENKSSTWASADNVLIVIKEGKIVRTSGLPNNLIAHQTPKKSFKDLIQSKDRVIKYVSYYSYDKPSLNGLQVEIISSVKNIEEVEILGELKSLILIEESLQNLDINWKRINKYWVDPKTYYVWKSVQFISPKLPSFTLEVTKKPAI